jgi:hypothetical protein
MSPAPTSSRAPTIAVTRRAFAKGADRLGLRVGLPVDLAERQSPRLEHAGDGIVVALPLVSVDAGLLHA